MALDVAAIRREFPILSQTINGKPLVYLDSAATAQKPRAVLERIRRFYEEENSNVHRGMHQLAERATIAYEAARETVGNFIHAARTEEIIFTKSCTEAINLVARTWGKTHLQEDDVIVLSILEHHSNIVPWLQLKEECGVDVKWIDVDDSGRLDMDMLEEFLNEGNVKLVAMTAQSNVLGVRPPIHDIARAAHARGARILLDAAQYVTHQPIDIQSLDCDFLAFSGHKLYGPTGIGVLYGKKELLESMPPFLGGGMMIREVHQDRFTPADLPAKFEAGTPPIAEAVGLAAAIEWLSQFSWQDIEAHEDSLLQEAARALRPVHGLAFLGPLVAPHPLPNAIPISGCLSFTIDGVHPHDLTDILGREGICLRAGHHCAQPLHRRLGVSASTRVSVGIYNTVEEITALSPAISAAVKPLRR